MSSNPYKAFIPYTVHPAVCSNLALRLPDDIERFVSSNPIGGSWRTMGLTNALDDLVHDLDSAGSMMCVQFNERILPGKVRDEKLTARKQQLEAQERRKLTKKEYAQLREEVEFDLLPKAFIRRAEVPVIFLHPNIMLVCTSSQKRADDAVALLTAVFEHLEPVKISVVRSVVEWLTTLAKESLVDNGIDFIASKSAVLRGDDKKVIRIKDRDIYGHEVQKLLSTSDYSVHELAIDATDYSSDLMSFVLNDNLTFKRCVLPDTLAKQHKEDLHAFAWISAKTSKQVLLALIEAMGGMTKAAASSASSDDEEEL